MVCTRPRRLPLLLLVIALSTAALTAQSRTRSLEEIYLRARELDPSIEAAELRVAQARLESQSRWNRYLPSVELGTSLSRRTTSDGPEWSGSLSASAALALPRGAAEEGERLTVAEAAATVELRRLESELLREVREEYYALLLARERLRIAERNGELEAQRLEQVEVLFEQGRASELDLLETRSQALRRRPEIIGRREALLLERNGLEARLRLEPGDELILEGAEELSTLTEALAAGRYEPPGVERVLAGSHRIEAQELEVRRARAQEGVTVAERNLPGVSASYSYSPSVSPPFDGEGWGSGATWETGTLSFRLTLPVTPFVPGSRESNAVIAASREVEGREIELAEAEREVRLKVEELGALLNFSLEKIEVLEEAVEMARTLYEESQEIYESGGVELLDVENAQAELEQAELDLLQERYNTVVRLAELEALAGRRSIRE
ncbi:MAG: TolC family protein [Alkalispirochaetaceae bacterium]